MSNLSQKSKVDILAEQYKVRDERIQQLKDEEVRNAIEKIKEEWRVKESEIKKDQELNFDRNVEKTLKSRIQQRNAPQLTPEDMRRPPILTKVQEGELRGQIIEERKLADTDYISQERKPYNRQIDQLLDEADKKLALEREKTLTHERASETTPERQLTPSHPDNRPVRHYDQEKQPDKTVAERLAESRARNIAEAERRRSLTPEQRREEDRQRDAERAREHERGRWRER